MISLETTAKNLEARGFQARVFAHGTEATDYLCASLSGEEIAFGGSMTLEQLGLFERLSEHNSLIWHMRVPGKETMRRAAAAPVYITSANALAQTGEIINIDGTGNRVAATLYGKKKVIFVVGVNKIAEDEESALWRARNIAGPLNARRLNKNTPCAKGELKCHDCRVSERICRGLVVLWNKLTGVDEMEVLLINENLGY